MTTSLVTGTIGAAIGFVVTGGNPMGASYGWMIGSAIGGMYEYSQMPDTKGPQLDDLSVQVSSYGAPMPETWGADRVAGNMIWKTQLIPIEHDTDGSSKKSGGPSATYFTYDLNCAIHIGKGPIFGVPRIWANKRVIYDYRAGHTPFVDNTSIGAFRLYLGTETQNPDPLIEATEGTTNANRGEAYIVFENFHLTENYGNHPPQFEFEVVKNGHSDAQITNLLEYDAFTGPDSLTYVAASDELWVLNSTASGFTRLSPDTGGSFGVIDLDAYLNANCTVSALPVVYDWVNGWVWCWTQDSSRDNHGDSILRIDAYTGVVERAFRRADFEWAYLAVNPYTGTVMVRTMSPGNGITVIDPDTGGSVASYDTLSAPGLMLAFDKDGRAWWGSASLPGSSPAVATPTLVSLQIEPSSGSPFVPQGTETAYDVGAAMTNTPLFLTYDPYRNSIWATGSNAGFPASTCEFDLDTLAVATTISSYGGTTTSTFSGRMVYDSLRQTVWFADTGTPDYIYGFTTYDTAEYRERISGVTVLGGIVYDPSRGSLFLIGQYAGSPSSLLRLDLDLISAETLTLAELVTDLCEQGGLSATDIDVTQLETDIVVGYTRPRQMSVRVAIEPLQGAYFFDVTPIDYKLHFVKRSGNSIATIPAADRGAYVLGDEPPAHISSSRTADLELPLELEFRFSDADRDYLISSAYARRLTHDAKSYVPIDNPVVMHGDKALENAYSHLYQSYDRRDDFQWTTTRKYDEHTPTDTVTLPTDNEDYVVRITSKNNIGNGVIEWTGVKEAATSYPSAATTITPDSVASTASVGEPTLTPVSTGGSITVANLSSLEFPWGVGLRVYVPELDELWVAEDTWGGMDWMVGTEIVRFDAQGGSPSSSGYVAIPHQGGAASYDQNIPSQMLYDPVHSCVWAFGGSLDGANDYRRIWQIDAATATVIATHSIGEDYGQMYVNEYTGDIWWTASGAGNVLKRMTPGGSPTFDRVITLPVGWSIHKAGFTPDGQYMWGIAWNTTTVTKIDLEAGTYVVYDLGATSPPTLTSSILSAVYDAVRNSLWIRQTASIVEWDCDLLSVTTTVAYTSNGSSDFYRLEFDKVNRVVWFTRGNEDKAYAIDADTGNVAVVGSPQELDNPVAVDVGYTLGSPTRSKAFTFSNTFPFYMLARLDYTS